MNSSLEDSTESRLLKVIEDRRLDPAVAAALAGDRPCSAAEMRGIERLRARYGRAFYSELMFTLTNRYWTWGQAASIWAKVVAHKRELEDALGRSVGVSVACLDYLSNVREDIVDPVFLSYDRMQQLADFAIRDGLTGLLDHSAFMARLDVEISRYERHAVQSSLLMIDIDDFKAINDRHGHQEGDRVLCVVADTITRNIRDLDVAGRYGGEEFAVLLPHAEPGSAARTAERIRSAIAFADQIHGVTVSVGIANCPYDALSASDLVRRADKALYRSKAAGKNRCSSSRRVAEKLS